MREGTVKWFNRKHGYGFIVDEQVGDVFVHFSEISGEGDRQLREGDIVEYEVVKGEKGPKAAQVIKKSIEPVND